MKKRTVLLVIINIGIWSWAGYALKASGISGIISAAVAPGLHLRHEIIDTLKIDPRYKKRHPAPLVKIVEEKDLAGGISVKKIFFQTTAETVSYGYLFYPSGMTGKYPAVIVFHGHGRGIVNTAFDSSSYEKAAAGFLARNGYVTFTYSFGGLDRSLGYETHGEAARGMLLGGRPLLGRYVDSGFRAIDAVTSFDFVDSSRIGVAGTSLGGHVAVYVAALDSRVKCVADAAYLHSYAELLDEKTACVCNFLPGVLGKFDFPQVAASIAPRPAIYIIGKNDMTKPWQMALLAYKEELEPEYKKRGRADDVRLLIHEGGHEMVLGPLLDWFDHHLK